MKNVQNITQQTNNNPVNERHNVRVQLQDGTTYRVSWQHIAPALVNGPPSIGMTKEARARDVVDALYNLKHTELYGRVTDVSLCFVRKMRDGERVVHDGDPQGVAYCNYKDAFSKETGRKVSLHEALTKLFPGKEHVAVRRAFWDAYRTRK